MYLSDSIVTFVNEMKEFWIPKEGSCKKYTHHTNISLNSSSSKAVANVSSKQGIVQELFNVVKYSQLLD